MNKTINPVFDSYVCPHCGGNGISIGRRCMGCGGTGRLSTLESIPADLKAACQKDDWSKVREIISRLELWIEEYRKRGFPL